MSIPNEWLEEPIAVDEIEDELASLWVPEGWLERWEALLGKMGPDDRLWEYCGWEPVDFDGGESADDDWCPCRVGFALVRDGRIIDWLDASFLC